ncbi:MAG: hypothetical protein FJ135_02240 [Deltaproteobacteria bacterium]|nr:hypothetical protein [Deltaproteobacteria bacterium]
MPARLRIIIIVFSLLMALVFTLYRVYTPWNLNHDQINLGLFVAKNADPDLFLKDYAFHDNSQFSHYLPVFLTVLTFLQQLTGSFEKGLWSLVPLLVFVYALGWSILLWRLTGSLWITLLFTFLALPYRPVPMGEVWGVAGVDGIVGRTLVTAISPYLFLLFFSWLEEPKYSSVIVLGLLTGLSAFIYPLTPLFFIGLLSGLVFLACWSHKENWGMLAVMLAVFAAISIYPGLLKERQLWVAAANISFAEFREITQIIFKVPAHWHSYQANPIFRYILLLFGVLFITGANYLLSPKDRRPQAAYYVWLLGGLSIVYICWRVVGKGAGLSWLYLTLAVYVILCFRRREISRFDWWLLGWGYVTLIIYLVPYYALVTVWRLGENVPLTAWVVEYRRVARLIHPFSYLMGAQAAVLLVPWISNILKQREGIAAGEYALIMLSMFNQMFFWLTLSSVVLFESGRLLLGSRSQMRAGAIAAAIMILLLATQLSTGRLNLSSDELFEPVQAFRQYSPAELQAEEELASWARRHTDKQALFYHSSPLFRYLAKRSITHAYTTAGEAANYRTITMVETYHRNLRLKSALDDPAALIHQARQLQVDYIVVDKDKPTRLHFPIIYENQKYLVYQNLPPGENGRP